MWPLRIVLAGLIAAAPVIAAAAPPPAPEPTVSELVVEALRSVSELVVTAPLTCLRAKSTGGGAASPPRVVSSFPAPGQVVRPGLIVMRLTFDMPMTCSGAIRGDAAVATDPCPKGVEQLLLSLDRRTVRTVCFLAPDKRYAVWGLRFVGLSGGSAAPYRFEFATSGGGDVLTSCEALAEDAETAKAIAERRPMDCAASSPRPADVRKVQDLRREAVLAQLEQEAARVESAARDLTRAQALGEAAYKKALAGLRAKAAKMAAEDEQLSDQAARAQRQLTPPSRADSAFDTTVRVRSASRSAPKGQAPAPPGVSLDEWSQSVFVNGRQFDCRLVDAEVRCAQAPAGSALPGA